MSITDSDSMTPNQHLVEFDKKSFHAVFFKDCQSWDGAQVAAAITLGLKTLNDRALRADMQIVSTTTLQNSYSMPDGTGHVCTTIICQWVDRETLASMQRQQKLMGGK
jgi:hypothetical protein